jgi:hypothetical protein
MLALKDPERLRAHLQTHAHHPEAAAALLRVELTCAPESARQHLQHLAQISPSIQSSWPLPVWPPCSWGNTMLPRPSWSTEPGRLRPPPATPISSGRNFGSTRAWHAGQALSSAPTTMCQALPWKPSSLPMNRRPKTWSPPERIAELLNSWQGFEEIRLGALSFLSLRDPENWQLSAELAWTNFRAFRLREGAEELALAWESAQRQGTAEELIAYVAARDPSGYMARLLPCTPTADSGRNSLTETPCSTSCASTTSP